MSANRATTRNAAKLPKMQKDLTAEERNLIDRFIQQGKVNVYPEGHTSPPKESIGGNKKLSSKYVIRKDADGVKRIVKKKKGK